MSSPLRVLILGGTSEGAAIAAALGSRSGFDVWSSLAGRVAKPQTPVGAVRVGGFGGLDGLIELLAKERVHAVIDATHPFAANISAHAYAACRERRIPLVALVREEWEPQSSDDWRHARDVEHAAELASQTGERIFVTTGRQKVAAYAAFDRWFLIRTIDPPGGPLPKRHELLLARGPFTIEGERRLLRDRAIDVIVSKNSGGPATYAKIEAARELGIPVVMVRRPALPDAPRVSSVCAAVAWAQALCP